jgi:hypothetical protein
MTTVLFFCCHISEVFVIYELLYYIPYPSNWIGAVSEEVTDSELGFSIREPSA